MAPTAESFPWGPWHLAAVAGETGWTPEQVLTWVNVVRITTKVAPCPADVIGYIANREQEAASPKVVE